MKPFTTIERWTIYLTALWFGNWAFPKSTSASAVTALLTAMLTALALVAIVLWIKDGTDRHL